MNMKEIGPGGVGSWCPLKSAKETYFSFSPFMLIPSFSQERTLAGLEDALKIHVITSSCPARGFFGRVVIDRDFGGTEGNLNRGIRLRGT